MRTPPGRRGAAALGLAIAMLLLVAAPATAQGRQVAPPLTGATPTAPAGTAPTVQPTQPPKGWILVDADTGAVMGGGNERTPLSPASTIKLLTALVAVQRLPVHDQVPISALAESKPARKINVKSGQAWDFQDLLYSMMLVSANDAAYAVAERTGDGSLDEWTRIADATADRLGLADQPVLNDPSGLDDSTFGRLGGDRISARDMAIVARAVLRQPNLMPIIQTAHYEFRGGDGGHHTLNNHDTFLNLYPGATGLKTGTTDLAGRCLVATATRDGRTMVVVELDAPNIYATATELLDRGFSIPPSEEAAMEHLPSVVPDAALTPQPTTTIEQTAAPAAATVRGTKPSSGLDLNSPMVAILVALLGGLPLLLLVRRRGQRREAMAAAARQPPDQDAAHPPRTPVG